MKNNCVSFGAVCVLVVGVFAAYIASPVSQSGEESSIKVSKDESFQAIAEELYQKNLIRHPIPLILVGNSLYRLRFIKEGEYHIAPREGLLSIAKKLAIGAPRKEKTIIIPEGWTLFDIGSYFERMGLFGRKEFMNALNDDWESTYSFLSGISTRTNLEGYLFPDTYRIFENASPHDIIAKMLDTFEKKAVVEYQKEPRVITHSLNDVLILASIIEREVTSDEDRAIVADIFYRRMKYGMPLQADSTVNYITGKKTAALSISDTLIDSPYNTYRIKGLPPSPICNPGLSSLRAALHPQSNPFLFFLTKKDGTTVFARTFDEHVRNKRLYLQ